MRSLDTTGLKGLTSGLEIREGIPSRIMEISPHDIRSNTRVCSSTLQNKNLLRTSVDVQGFGNTFRHASEILAIGL
ncbi:hypothetical protein CEXT_148821 [Caerostris extrusa]|uniref:Uncharacterized protein n=1 Tax=Caerostris extrusa TaxID=172846 RepID=A0AAV4RSA4_CAEEX|nr:hypothetical protein CEXT_148821 [Caerostris extrusa]